MKTIIDTYNNNSHRTLGNKTPNQVFKDNDDQMTRHLNDSVHNQKNYQSVPSNSDGAQRRRDTSGAYFITETCAPSVSRPVLETGSPCLRRAVAFQPG